MRRLAFLTVGLSTATVATAQDAAPQLNAVFKCQSETGNIARLACFDNAVGDLNRASKEKQILVLDRNVVVARNQGRFGLPSAQGDTFGGGEADRQTAVADLDTTVLSAYPTKQMPGRWTLVLNNGMVWQTLEGSINNAPAGTTIKLRRSSLGGYRILIGGASRSLPVKRLR